MPASEASDCGRCMSQTDGRPAEAGPVLHATMTTHRRQIAGADAIESSRLSKGGQCRGCPVGRKGRRSSAGVEVVLSP